MLGLEPTPLGSYSRLFSPPTSLYCLLWGSWIFFPRVLLHPGFICYFVLLSNLIWSFLVTFSLFDPRGLQTAPKRERHGGPEKSRLEKSLNNPAPTEVAPPPPNYSVQMEWKMTTFFPYQLPSMPFHTHCFTQDKTVVSSFQNRENKKSRIEQYIYLSWLSEMTFSLTF